MCQAFAVCPGSIKNRKIFALIDLPFHLILSVKAGNYKRTKGRIVLFAFTLSLSIGLVCYQFIHLEDSKILGNYKLRPILMSTVGNHMFDLYRFIYEKTDTLSNKDTDAVTGWLEQNEALFKQSLLEIDKLKKPFNLFIIILTSHMPFDFDKSLHSLDLPKDDITNNYLQSIHYTDKVFGEFCDNLVSNGILDNAVPIIYGDQVGIHKYYKKLAKSTFTSSFESRY